MLWAEKQSRALTAAAGRLSVWFYRLGDTYKAIGALTLSAVLVSLPGLLGYEANSMSAALALVGAIVLAIPALRVNAQARLVYALSTRLADLDRQEAVAKALDDEQLASQTLATIETDRKHAMAAHASSSKEKGSWRPWLELLL